MAYTITKSDGTILLTLGDTKIDQLTTSLTLIGKNYAGYGTFLNENFVKLLENFASTTAPLHPKTGPAGPTDAGHVVNYPHSIWSRLPSIPGRVAALSNRSPLRESIPAG